MNKILEALKQGQICPQEASLLTTVSNLIHRGGGDPSDYIEQKIALAKKK
ncbi:MAG TPA: hypothetical protein P5280_02390 [Cyclobacteriaceae bacterium]|nr:hypothetical protein [Cyclobacteriaceae bacterium]